MSDTAIEHTLADPDYIIQLATQWKEERAKRWVLKSENAQQKQMLVEYSPKASYYDVVLQTKDAETANDEIFVVLRSTTAARDFESEFSNMWADTQHYVNY